MAKKNYIIDTNILLEDHKSIQTLINGNENKIFITKTVLNELSGLKKDNRLKERVIRVIDEILLNSDYITIIDNSTRPTNDDLILKDILRTPELQNQDSIFVTNDKLLSFKSKKNGVQTQEYKQSIPFSSESEMYTGILPDTENLINNCFYWNNGKPYFYRKNISKIIGHENEIWKIKPKNIYQNLAFELLLNQEIELVSIQSKAGAGKTLLSLASALYLAFEKNLYERIVILKPHIDVGKKELGFLPGNLEEKLFPYFRPIIDLLLKLNKLRPNKKICKDNRIINEEYIEFLPINYLRGSTIDNAVVIIDEIQNLSKSELITVLTRMGQNVKCICTGDVQQIDNSFLNKENNGMNWLVKLFKNELLYAHIVLKGDNIRGNICDLVNSKNV